MKVGKVKILQKPSDLKVVLLKTFKNLQLEGYNSRPGQTRLLGIWKHYKIMLITFLHMTEYGICFSQDNLLFRRIDILVSLATLYLAGFLVNKCWPVKVSKGNCIDRETIAKYWQGNCFLSFLCNWQGNLPFFAIRAMKIIFYIKNLVSDERKYSFPQLHRRKTF